MRRATGSWLPLWSQGFAVCLSPPCTDEPRIRLEIGDVVKVTRWKKYVQTCNAESSEKSTRCFAKQKNIDNIVNSNNFLVISRHWLFGERTGESTSKNGEITSANETKTIRCRGWFPRKCAVELVCPDSDEDQEHFNNKKIN